MGHDLISSFAKASTVPASESVAVEAESATRNEGSGSATEINVLRRFRFAIFAACAFGLVPWVVTCIYVPVTGGPTDLATWEIIGWIFQIFAPMELVFVEVLPFYFAIISSHTRWDYHYLSWSSFAVLNVGFWLLVFCLAKLVKDRVVG